MIKYVTYDSIDETGQHIIPVNNLYHMNKTASGTYSQDLMKVILNMKRSDDLYYVVINALGSHEIWGSNRNGDGFPASGLMNKSLRTDMGTINDFGFKTFEYYAHLYKHHVNKDPKKSFGKVIYAHWNPDIQRVELIVGINKSNGSDMIDKIEKGENVAVSMGCKVKYDRCSICDNKAKTRKTYCKHLTNYMNHIVTEDLAKAWSKELGKIILPGAQVFAWNDFPRFFDISDVFVGADRSAYMLGKAAHIGNTYYSTDVAEALGVTDDHIDKLAMVSKKGEIEKQIGGALGPNDIDGKVVAMSNAKVMKKALDAKVSKSIVAEPLLPKNLLDSMAPLPLETIFSTMLGLGIFPKPAEVQRIIIVKAGHKGIADELDRNREVFDYNDHSCPCQMNLNNSKFSDTLGKALAPFLASRSAFPSFLSPRLTKEAEYNSIVGQDYWNRPTSAEAVAQSKIKPELAIAGGLAALYAGLKLKSLGYGPRQLAEIFSQRQWIKNLIGGGVMARIYSKFGQADPNDPMLRPASDYEGILQDTNFSGHVKTSGYDQVIEAILLPNAYIANAIGQPAVYDSSKVFMLKTASVGKSTMMSQSLINQRSISDLKNGIEKILPTT